MIKTISTYKLSIPFVSPATSIKCTEYTIKLYVWSGLKTAVPITANYEITKKNIAESSGTEKVNISRLLDDYISFVPVRSATTGLLSQTNQKWCAIKVYYTTGNATDVGLAQLEQTLLIVKGYGYGNEVENPQTPTDRIHITGREFKVSRTTVFTIPIKLLEA